MKPDFLYAFDKVLKTIKSCQTMPQWVQSRRLHDLFEKMYEIERYDPNKNIYFINLNSWLEVKLNKIINSNNTSNNTVN